MFRALAYAVFTVALACAASQIDAAAQGSKAPTGAALSEVEVRIFVATGGNDSWTGKQADVNAALGTGPVRTLGRAQLIAREQLAAMATAKQRLPIRVLIAAGTYQLDSTLVFTAADSGTADAPVSYESASAGAVVLSGGVPLVLRTAANGGAPAAFALPAIARGTGLGAGQLFVNGDWATLAREPKAGQYWFVQRSVPLDSEPKAESGREAFIPSAEAAGWIAKLAPAERSRAIVQLMHSWTSSQHHLASTDAPAGAIRITPRTLWGFLSSGSSQRFFIENVPSALNSAGEWVATDSEVLYLPTAEQVGKKLDVVLPVLERLVSVRGVSAGGQWAQYLVFRGLTFTHTRHLTTEAGFTDTQAAVEMGAAVEIDGAHHITIERCTFNNIAGHALWLRKSVRDSNISHSAFSHLGAGAIKIGVAKEKLDEPVPTDRNTAANNRIDHTGLLFPGAVGIWLGQGHENVVANNLIQDTTYTGISVGWNWAFNPSASGRHRIVDNLLFNIGNAQLSDLGGIYTLGDLSGTVISGNVVRDVRAYPGYGPGRGQGGWGIYNDLGSSNLVVENNIVVGTDSGGYHLNGGRQLTVRQNLFAGGKGAEVRVSRTSGTVPQAKFDGNFIVSATSQAFEGLANTQELAFSDNKVSGVSTAAPPDLARCGSGCAESQVRVAAAANAKDIRFEGMEPADATRLAAIVSRAGPAPGSTTNAKAAVAGKVPTFILAPTMTLPLDLRNARPGSQPAGFEYRPVGDKQAIKMADMASAPGGKCLQFNDSATMTHRFEPYAFTNLNHETGGETVEFSILVDAETNFVHEWRDDDKPYRVGPSLRLTAAGISVAGKVVAPVSVGQWMRLKVSATLGKAGAAWQLDVRTADGKTFTFPALKPVSANWQSLNSLYYISDAAVTSSLCVSDLTITNSAGKN